MQSKATTVAEYIASLPPDRKAAITKIREAIRKNLDEDIEEIMQYGMIGYAIPHRVFPQGCHCNPKQPLPFGGLASQKNHISIYLMDLYADSEQEKKFRAAWEKTGRKLDMGKCCIRFKKLEDCALDVIADHVRKTTAKKYIAWYQSALDTRTSGKTPSAKPKKSAAKTTTKKSASKPAKR
jgi:hypothetical protein